MKTEPTLLSVLGFPRHLWPWHQGRSTDRVSLLSAHWHKPLCKILTCVPRIAVTVSLVFAVLSLPPVAAGAGLEGRWEGKIDRSGKAQAISVDLALDDNGWQGSIDIPDEAIAGRPLQHIMFEGGGVQFETQVMGVKLSFEGRREGDKITGTFSQGTEKLPFFIERKSSATSLGRSPSPSAGGFTRNQPAVLGNAQAGTRGQTSFVKEEDRHRVEEVNRKGTDYALLFACEEYDRGWRKLSNPIGDVEAIADVLRRVYHFKVKVVKNATLDEIEATIREYKAIQYSKQDQLLIFFAGHGTYDEEKDRGYLVARDSDISDKHKGSYFDFPAMQTMVDAIPCYHILLVLDVCQGGTALGERRDDPSEHPPTPNMEVVIQKLEMYPTRKILTSGGKEYVGDGVPGHHSPFASNFLSAIGGFERQESVFDIFEIYGKINKYRGAKDAEPQFGSFGRDLRASDFYFIVTSTPQTPPRN